MGADNRDKDSPPKPEPPETDLLAPLEGDELFEMEPDTLADLIDTEFDGSQLETEGDNHKEETDTYLDEIDDNSWLDDGVDDRIPEAAEFLSDDGDEGWSDSKEGESDDLDIGWFVPSDDTADGMTDDGAEGPESERIEIDDSDWAPLDDGDDAEDDEDIFDTMDRLGMSVEEIAAEEEDAVFESGPTAFEDASFLGPETGEVLAVQFIGESPFAVGDGFYVLGADEMFHQTEASERLGELMGNSITSHGKAVFIGTKKGGAYVTYDKGATVAPINSWYLHGFGDGVGVSIDDVSTPFFVSGHTLSRRFVLLGRTAKGQLFASKDDGVNWKGPILKGLCLSPPQTVGKSTVMAVIDLPGRGPTLCRTRDLAKWGIIKLPESLEPYLKNGELVFAGGGSTLIVGASHPNGPCYKSLNRGSTWKPVEGITDLCAAAIDPDDPGFIVLGAYVKDRAASRVRVSDDCGETWQTVLAVHANQYKTEENAIHCRRVMSLAVHSGKRRRILVQSGQGVYLVTMTRKDFAH